MIRSLTHQRLRDVLDYDPMTGEFRWRFDKTGRYAREGARAGAINGDGYRQICIDRVIYGAGPLAVFWITGEWPARFVDHINGDKDDNRWCNIRDATVSQNGFNSRAVKNKKYSPLKGVTFHRGRYMAQIKVNYRPIYLGRFDTPEEAHAAYMTAARKYFGEYARAD